MKIYNLAYNEKIDFSMILIKSRGSRKYSENIKLRKHFHVKILSYVLWLRGTSQKTKTINSIRMHISFSLP